VVQPLAAGLHALLRSCEARRGARLDASGRVVPLDRFGAALMYFTGSKEHNIALRERAIAQGMRLNEYGLFRENEKGEVAEGAVPVAASSERRGRVWASFCGRRPANSGRASRTSNTSEQAM
jgi:hypothetical protein